MKNSSKIGKISSKCEVVNISPFGIWLLFGSKEYFLDHKRYPWFRGAKVEQVLNVKAVGKEHIRWPNLDIDLHLDSLENPDRYPLIFKGSRELNKKQRNVA